VGGGGGGGGSADAAGSGSSDPAAPPTTGNLELRVEWKDAPAAVRASPGRTPCGGARRGRAKVHTLWGVANAIVFVEDAGPSAGAGAPPVMLTVRDCELTPTALVVASAPAAVRVYNADAKTQAVTIEPAITLDDLAGAPVKVTKKASRAALPWMGSEIEAAIAQPGALAIATADAPGDLAWVLAPPAGGAAAVTDDTGVAGFDRLAPGTHAITAWLPPAAGEKARVVTGEATIAVGKTTKLTIDLAARTVKPTPAPTYSAGQGAGSGSADDE
jgi:hypothetical protein